MPITVEIEIHNLRTLVQYQEYLQVCQEHGMTATEFNGKVLELGLKAIGKLNPKKSSRRLNQEILATINP